MLRKKIPMFVGKVVFFEVVMGSMGGLYTDYFGVIWVVAGCMDLSRVVSSCRG